MRKITPKDVTITVLPDTDPISSRLWWNFEMDGRTWGDYIILDGNEITMEAMSMLLEHATASIEAINKKNGF